MVSKTLVVGDSERFSNCLADYKKRFESLESDWQGPSYNSLKEKAFTFVNDASVITKMMSIFAEICSLIDSFQSYASDTNNESSVAAQQKKIGDSINSKAEDLFSIRDLDTVSVGTTNFTDRNYFSGYFKNSDYIDGLFRLNTNISSNTAFESLVREMSQIKSSVSSYDISVRVTGFSTDVMSRLKDKLVKNLETCAGRMKNTVTVIDAVVENHQALQEKFVKYLQSSRVTGYGSADSYANGMYYGNTGNFGSNGYDETSTEKGKGLYDPLEEATIEVQLPVEEEQATPAGVGGGYGGGVVETPEPEPVPEPEVPAEPEPVPEPEVPAEPEPEIEPEVDTGIVSGGPNPVVQDKTQVSHGIGVVPALAGIGLVGAAGGGLALLAGQKKKLEEEDEDLDNDDELDGSFDLNLRKKKSNDDTNEETKEWLYDLGLGVGNSNGGFTEEDISVGGKGK